ncbi:hypothetical protein RMR16_020545 [Agrobacterium sp. rho-13.3]|uniref:hypothetical protein n=1 Tax=Agrobacterium sp. rho-13.3 TaxID=3072980 RepID=UPI002A0ADA2D|nr:hypothetical protein [Agrobacterium sp. rho-13.3]MDX8306294.1 hypothetical protein [Agrobacterium sp. rho-13.3]MDX8307375.1 hypothetical protein [Agrobacterium sp. rho-13.3]
MTADEPALNNTKEGQPCLAFFVAQKIIMSSREYSQTDIIVILTVSGDGPFCHLTSMLPDDLRESPRHTRNPFLISCIYRPLCNSIWSTHMTKQPRKEYVRGQSPRGDFETTKTSATNAEDERVTANRKKTKALQAARLARETQFPTIAVESTD